MNPKDNKTNNVFKINMDEIFSSEWIKNIEEAIDFALKNLKNKNIDREKLINYIIDYNMKQKIDSIIQENAFNAIPTKLDWSKKDYMFILSELYAILDYCDMSKSFQVYTGEIKLNSKKVCIYNFDEIESITGVDYPKLSVKFDKLESRNKYKLTVSRKQN